MNAAAVLQLVRFAVELFFFKQKTADERRVSPLSSDVCSSDLQDAGKLVFGLPLLRLEFPQGAHQAARVAASVVGEHPYQPERFGFRGADVLFEAGVRPRHDDRPLVEREDFAERVVAAHLDAPLGAVEEALDVGLESDRSNLGKPLRPIAPAIMPSGLTDRTK